jgi:hypothetical protein
MMNVKLSRWQQFQVWIAWHAWAFAWWLIARNSTKQGLFELYRRQFNESNGYDMKFESDLRNEVFTYENERDKN